MNKSSYLIVIFVITSLGLVFGQSHIGVFGGMNYSKLAGDAPQDVSYGSTIGFNSGAYFDLQINKSIILSLQPSYYQEGAKMLYNVDGVDELVDSAQLRLNYFSIPLIVKVNTVKERFYALAGIETGLLLNSYALINEKEEDINASIAQWNMAMHFGVGMRIPIGVPRLFVELRYSQGLVNLTDDPLGNNLIPRVKTSGLKVLAGIEIPLKSKK